MPSTPVVPAETLAGINYASDEAGERANDLAKSVGLGASHFRGIKPSGKRGEYTVKDVLRAAGVG